MRRGPTNTRRPAPANTAEYLEVCTRLSLAAALGHATHTLVQQTHDAARRRVHYVRTAMRTTAAETQQRRGLPCRAYRRPSKGTDNRNNGTDNRNNGTDNRNNGTDNRNKGTDNRNKGTDKRNKGTDNRAYRRRSPQSDAARCAPSSGRGRACALRCPLRSTTSGADSYGRKRGAERPSGMRSGRSRGYALSQQCVPSVPCDRPTRGRPREAAAPVHG
jgi:hypothetical protein